jgi:hypothetical protein
MNMTRDFENMAGTEALKYTMGGRQEYSRWRLDAHNALTFATVRV